MTSIQEQLRKLRHEFAEIRPQIAFDQLSAGEFTIIDVREQEELETGLIPTAVHIPRGQLELQIESLISDKQQSILLYCAGGSRSLLAARDLRGLGYQNLTSLEGGFNRWKTEALPIDFPRRLSLEQRERYSRHLRIPEIGEAGQLKLLDSKVLLVGAGGLACPAAIYLAAAGVGEIGIIDPDIVSRSNLQRQILHTEGRIGQSKVDSAKQALLALNPEIMVNCYQAHLLANNALELIAQYDLVIDGTDNFAARYLVNDACVILKKPNVHGAIFRFEGQLSVFWPGGPIEHAPCYRCLFPEPPPAEQAPSCAEAGVLGVLPGTIGVLEAVEAIKILTGIGQPLVGRLVTYDALSCRFQELRVKPDPACLVCQADPGSITLQDMDRSCRL